MTARLDHVVLGAPDLAAAVGWFAGRTGVEPARGGSHPGWGTANHLVGLGGGAYLEIVGPDPSQPAPEQPRPFRVDELDAPRIVTWAVHSPDLAGAVAAARALGHDPGDPAPMSRRAPDGDLLEWRLTAPQTGDGGLLPFLIDWGTTPHPTTRALPQAPLVSLGGAHPDPARIGALLAALGTGLELDRADAPGLTLVLDTADGPVTFGP